jgi:hypothetical protein
LFLRSDTSFLPSDQDITNYGNYVYASFPVDVIVYFHMQPSTFRFSCLPVSRVECMLQLPSLDIVFSSKRAEDELFNSEFGDGTPNTAAFAVGGLSVTGCLSDFSVYIFHPYGGKKSALKEAQWSPLSDSERKDSLSINVEFVKFHLSRSRMLNFKQEGTAKGKGGDKSRAVIRFSSKLMSEGVGASMIYLFDRSDHRHRFGVVQVRHEAPHGDLGLPQSVVQAVDRPQDVPGGPEHVGSVQRRGRLGGVARLAQQPQESRDEEERKIAAAQQQGPPEAEPGVGRPPPQQT